MPLPPEDTSPTLVSVAVASLGVGIVALTTGLILVKRGAAGSCASHPYASATLCGLLISIGLLVVLPDAMDRLALEAGWPAERVIFIFLSTMVVMFILDHVALEHQHVTPGQRVRRAIAPPSVPQGSLLAGISLSDEPQEMETSRAPPKGPTKPGGGQRSPKCGYAPAMASEELAVVRPEPSAVFLGCEACDDDAVAIDCDESGVAVECDESEVAAATQAPPPLATPSDMTGPQSATAKATVLPTLATEPQFFNLGCECDDCGDPFAGTLRWIFSRVCPSPAQPHLLRHCLICARKRFCAGRAAFPMFTTRRKGGRSKTVPTPPAERLEAPSSAQIARADPTKADPTNRHLEGGATIDADIELAEKGILATSDEDKSSANASTAAALSLGVPPRSSACLARWSIALRMGAWMLHAAIDGMVLSSASSVYVLLATAVPVSLCAIQDVAAFSISLASRGCSNSGLLVGVVAFALAFPVGAIGSYLSTAGSQRFLLVLRVVVAGVFVYMATFELAPPHTHRCALAPV